MSRKKPLFSQLINYIRKGWENLSITHNLWAESMPVDQIIQWFSENSLRLKARKNWNYLYHEILSFEKVESLPEKALHKALIEIGEEYLSLRAENQLAYWMIHSDTWNPHIHFCISANNLWEEGRASISKANFSKIQAQLEKFVLENYPRLEQSAIYDRETNLKHFKTTQREQDYKKRTKQPSRKEELKNLLHWIFDQAPNRAGLEMLLNNHWYNLYQRWKTVWVIDSDGKKHRLKTLWVLPHFEALQERFLVKEKREQDTKISSKADDKDSFHSRMRELSRITEQNKEIDYSLTLNRMNSAQAKAIPLVTVLEKLWHQPHHRKGQDVWFLSPFREEKTPSFKVNLNLNTWYDFWLWTWGQGGTIIDFFMELHHESNISKVLWMIEGLGHWIITSPVQKSIPVKPRQTVKTPIIEDVRPIENKALIQYLESKWISLDLAKKYLSEIHYQQWDKSFFSLGYSNIQQGYETKNKYFKGTLWKKAITFFEWCAGECERVAVFEWITDFLSLLQLHGQEVAPMDSIILNSVSLTEQAVQQIRDWGYEQVQAYLDNDRAGDEALDFMTESLPGLEVSDFSDTYADFKDLNDYLISKNELKIILDKTTEEQKLSLGQNLELSL